MDSIDAATTTSALKSTHRGLRRMAIAHPSSDSLLASHFNANGVLAASDARELAELLTALCRQPASEEIGKLLFATLTNDRQSITSDPALNDAWQIAARHHAKGVILAAAGSAIAAPSAPVNLLPNASFNDASPAPWSLKVYSANQADDIKVSTSPNGRNGSTALMIQSSSRADAGAAAEVSIKPNTRYRLGGWIKTENIDTKPGRGAMMNAHTLAGQTSALTGTKDWTEVSAEFDSGNETSVIINCLFGGFGGSTGTAYWDDVYLHEVAAGDAGSLVMPLVSYFAASATEADKQALTAALSAKSDEFSKSLLTKLGAKAVEVKPVVRKNKPDAAVHARGIEVYAKTCIACHGPEGKGVPLAFPPLDGSARLVGDPSQPIAIVIHGLQGPLEVGGQKFNNIMAPLGDLTDQQVSDVLTYVRQSWTNDATPVTVETVTKVRAQNATRKTPLTAADLK